MYFVNPITATNTTISFMDKKYTHPQEKKDLRH